MKDKVSKFVSVLNGSNLKHESTAVVSVSCCAHAQLLSNSRWLRTMSTPNEVWVIEQPDFGCQSVSRWSVWLAFGRCHVVCLTSKYFTPFGKKSAKI